jgi:predicted metal-binding protein
VPTVETQDNETPQSEAMAESARIVSEICERLSELDALRPNGARHLISRLAILANESDHAFHLTIGLMHGDTTMLSPCARHDPTRKVTRQAASLRLQRTLRFLRSYSSPLADVVEQLKSMRLASIPPEHPLHQTAPTGMVRTYGHSHSGGGEG